MEIPEIGRSAIPEKHTGADYVEVLSTLGAKRGCRTYLEIGVASGALFARIESDTAIGIDPTFTLSADVTHSKSRVHLYKMTSDLFFSDPRNYSTIEGLVDFAFLDGMHAFEFLLRDFFNTERICHDRSLIALHDCLPLNDAMIQREFWTAAELGRDGPFPNHWTGDVWKVILILRKYRPDLRLVFVDAPPTGLVFATNLDPISQTLRANYLDIVEEFRRMENNIAALDQLYRSLCLTRTDEILSSHDHSLFFRL